jgi:hypothetical protein
MYTVNGMVATWKELIKVALVEAEKIDYDIEHPPPAAELSAT